MGTRTLGPTVEPIRFPFNERKALAADTHLLAVSDGGMAYMRLFKLLSLSGRRMIDEFHFSGRKFTAYLGLDQVFKI